MEPLLGFFWFVQFEDAPELIADALPFSMVPEIGGFRTLETGHYEFWSKRQRQDHRLKGIEYEEFPRGRVNYLAGDDCFLLLLDKKLRTAEFVGRIVREWNLPPAKVKVLLDPHYRSKRLLHKHKRGQL